MKMRLALTDIRLDESTQCRERTSEELVAEYAEAYRKGATLPPPVVFLDLDGDGAPRPGAKAWIGDGHKRVRAAAAAQLGDLEVDALRGGEEEAFLYALRANRDHGERVTAADKRNGVRKALERWPQLSDREIGRRADVGYTLVAKVRAELATARGGQLEETREGADGKVRRLPRPAEATAPPAAAAADPDPRQEPLFKPLFPTGPGPELAQLRAAQAAAPGAVTLVEDEDVREDEGALPLVRGDAAAHAAVAEGAGPAGATDAPGPAPGPAGDAGASVRPARGAAAKPGEPYDPTERLSLLRHSPCLKDVPGEERPAVAAALRQLAATLDPTRDEDGEEAMQAELLRLQARVRELEQEAALERSATCGACELAQERVRDLEHENHQLRNRLTVASLKEQAAEQGVARAAAEAEEETLPTPLRVALVGCGAKKLDHAAPARELYTGPLFKAALAYAEGRDDPGFDGIFILSAKHGLVKLGQQLEPYDATIEGLSTDERDALAVEVVAALAAELEGEPAEVTVLAGKEYVSLLVGGPWKLHTPLEGMGLLERLAWFKQQGEAEAGSPPGWKPSPPTEEEVKQGLRASLHHYEDSEKRWSALKAKGATDAELRAAISEAYGIYGSSGGPSQVSETHRGGKNPSVEIGERGAMVKLQGAKLVQAVRELLGIPLPAAAPPPAAPDPLAVKCPDCKAEPGRKCQNYKGQSKPPHRTRVAAAKAGAPPPEQGPLSVACPAEWCAVAVGELCKTSDGRTRAPHADRERAAAKGGA